MTRRWQLITSVLSLLMVAIVAAAIGGKDTSRTSAAGNNEVPGTLSGPGIIRYDTSQRPPIANSRMVIVQGAKDQQGTCHHRTAFFASNGDTRPQIARLVAADPETCRFQLERGTPTGVEALPIPQHPGSETESSGNAPRR